MSILDSELKLRPAFANGRMGTAEIVGGTLNSVFGRITRAMRISGHDETIKLFWHLAHAGTVEATTCLTWLGQTTPGTGTRVVLIGGATQRNVAGDLTGAERRYGVGKLHTAVAITDTTLVVDGEPGSGADEIFTAGDTLWISDGVHEEFVEIAVDGVAWSTDQATLTLSAGLTYAYDSATPTYIAACLPTATVVATADNEVAVGDFTFDSGGTDPIQVDGIGTVEQTWVLTFSGATTFSVLGDTVGSLGAGATNADFTPINPANGAKYFTLPAAAWGGTPESGDTFTFQTHPASIPFFALREVAVDAPAESGDGTTFNLDIQS